MRTPTQIFHALSYLQYPLLVAALVHVILATTRPEEEKLDAFNSALVFMGLAVSMSTLQDTSTTQNEFSRRIWSSPLLGRCFLFILGAVTLGFVALGLWGMYQASDHKVRQLSLGVMVLGMGLIGLLKAAGGMFEHHRRDRP